MWQMQRSDTSQELHINIKHPNGGEKCDTQETGMVLGSRQADFSISDIAEIFRHNRVSSLDTEWFE